MTAIGRGVKVVICGVSIMFRVLRLMLRLRRALVGVLLGDFGDEVGGFEDGANFDLASFYASGRGNAFNPFDGLFHGLDLPEPEAGNEFLGLGEGAVDDGGFAACKLELD